MIKFIFIYEDNCKKHFTEITLVFFHIILYFWHPISITGRMAQTSATAAFEKFMGR